MDWERRPSLINLLCSRRGANAISTGEFGGYIFVSTGRPATENKPGNPHKGFRSLNSVRMNVKKWRWVAVPYLQIVTHASGNVDVVNNKL